MAETPDFWPACGYRTLIHAADGQLRVSDDFLRHCFRLPEVEPIDSSCGNERSLHRSLLDNPNRPVSEDDLLQLADADARENYAVILAFRALLLTHDTLEQAYLAAVAGGPQQGIAPAFVDLLAQLILRGVLHDCDDAYRARAGELLFRRQKVGLDQGIVLADAERVARSQPASLSVLQSLVRQAGGVPADARETLDVLNQDTVDRYWRRSDSFELVLGLNFDEPGLPALCRVLEAWVAHFHGLEARIEARRDISDQRWRWHIGLDAESNRILNRLYAGEALSTEDEYQLLLLFQLEFADPSLLLPQMQDAPVYLGLAMNAGQELKLKPQNLVLNLPLAVPA